MFGFFFFLTIFVQDVLGYSPLRTGVAFLPFAGTLVVISGLAGRLVARAGARPLMVTGAAATSGGMYWFSASACTPPTPAACSARACSPPPAWACCSSRCRWLRSPGPRPGLRAGLQPAQHRPAGRRRDRPGRTWHRGLDGGRQQRPQPDRRRRGRRARRSPVGTQARASIYHALAAGITRGFLAASAIALAALVVAAVTIRIWREDLTSPAAAAGARGQRRSCSETSQHVVTAAHAATTINAAHAWKEHRDEHKTTPFSPRSSSMPTTARETRLGNWTTAPRLPGPCPARPAHDRPEVAADPRR